VPITGGAVAIETLAWGYGLIEGPRPAPDGGLYFSDVRNGGVNRLAPDGSVEVVIPRRRGVGGIALHADGGLVISGRNVCHVRDGTTRVLYERDDVGGFNDLFADERGRIYVGSLRDDPFIISDNRKTGDAYRIDGEGRAVTLYEGVGLSNGFGFSPDGKRLFHVDSAAGAVFASPVGDDGEVDGARRAIFAKIDRGVPDGLAVDREGGVWVALFGGGAVVRLRADGTVDRYLAVPALNVTSLCFAGAGLDQLIVVTADNTEDASRGGTIFRIDASAIGVAGLPAPLATI